MKDLVIEQKLGNIEEIPTLPIVLRQIQKVLKNPNTNMSQIAHVVAKDQALSARTIRLVNSAFYGLGKQVTSITNAIVILGLNTLNNLMLGLTVVKLFKDAKIRGFDPEEFWKHCFSTALIARYLAQYRDDLDPEECFICGLLHDMGRLVMDQYAQDDFLKALEISHKKDLSLYKCEETVFGFTHADIGAWLGRKWQLPESIFASLQYHHSFESIPNEYKNYTETVLAVASANDLTGIARIGNSGEHKYPAGSLKRYKGITKQMCAEVVSRARKQIDSTIAQWENAL